MTTQTKMSPWGPIAGIGAIAVIALAFLPIGYAQSPATSTTLDTQRAALVTYINAVKESSVNIVEASNAVSASCGRGEPVACRADIATSRIVYAAVQARLNSLPVDACIRQTHVLLTNAISQFDEASATEITGIDTRQVSVMQQGAAQVRAATNTLVAAKNQLKQDLQTCATKFGVV